MALLVSDRITDRAALPRVGFVPTRRDLFGTFTAELFPLVPVLGTEFDSGVLPVRLWGGMNRGPAATQFFIYTMVGSVAMLLAFLAIFPRPAKWISSNSPQWDVMVR